MKHKLILIFADDYEVVGINKVLLFNNALDAETYLLSTGKITSVNIDPNDNWFSFKETGNYSGNGKAYWAVDMS